MVFTLVFIIAFTWRVARGLSDSNNKSSVFTHSSNYKKSAVEIVIPRKQVLKTDYKTIHLNDFLLEKRSTEENVKIQTIAFNTFNDKRTSNLFLN